MMPMTSDEARAVERTPLSVGERRKFYSEVQQGSDPPGERLRRFTAQTVTVIRGPLGPDENDPENSPLYEVRADDGTKFQAWQEELNGWDYDLGQFFWPDGTYGPDHSTEFLVNERYSDDEPDEKAAYQQLGREGRV